MRSDLPLGLSEVDMQPTLLAEPARAPDSNAGDRQAIRFHNLCAALHACHEAAAEATGGPKLLTEICRIAVKYSGCALAFVDEVGEATPESSDRPYAAASKKDEVDYGLLSQSAIARRGGPFAESAAHGQPCVCNEITRYERDRAWSKLLSKAGFQSAAAIPIRLNEKQWGILGAYSHEQNYFDTALLKLLEQLVAILARALDRSERDRTLKSLEARLHHSQALAESVVTAAFDPVICLDEKGEIIVFNPAAERVFGWEANSALGRDFIDVLVPVRFRAKRRITWNEFAETGQSEYINRRREVLALCRDGTELMVEIVTIPTRNDSRLIVTLYLRDISKIKHDQQVLGEVAARYRQLVEHSPEALLVHRDGVLILANKACQRLLGVTYEDQLLGRDLFDFVRADYHATARRSTSTTTPESVSARFLEQVWLRTDGSEATLEVAATRVEYEGAIAHQVVLRDVTERKRYEDGQSRQNHVLSLIASDASLPDIMKELVVLVEAGGTRARASFMLLSPDGKFLHECVAPSFAPEFRAALEPFPVSETSAVCGTAAFRGEPVIVRDVTTAPETIPFLELASAHKIGAAASWPIMGKRGQILGTFALYFSEPCEPNDVEMGLIALATDLAAIAIESQLADKRIRYLAHYDELTALPNRVLFRQLLGHELERARAKNGKLATLFLDLDRFKNINDTFGHGSGDDVLREVGSRLRATLVESDQIARMGGDEFFVLLKDCSDAREITTVARRILEVAARPFFINGEECQLSASIGIAVFPDDGEDGDTLLKNADIAMYRAKGEGKNTFQFYSASKNIHTIQRMSLQSRLRRAIENREFVVHYQPRVDMQTGQVKGVEALVRWEHPERGLLLPGEFISIAEETGLIVPLGFNILEIAFRDAKRFEHALGHKLRIAVNLSVRQIDEVNFVQSVRALLEANQLDADAIELEITESMLIHNPEHAEQVMGELSAMGIAVAIDDFGTGYSSLTYLKRFPVETVKVDRSFIQELPDDTNDLAITQAIIAMAHSLGLKVVAEGVETPEQARTLRAMGCDEYQGFLFSKAVPFERVLQLIESTPVVD